MSRKHLLSLPNAMLNKSYCQYFDIYKLKMFKRFKVKGLPSYSSLEDMDFTMVFEENSGNNQCEGASSHGIIGW